MDSEGTQSGEHFVFQRFVVAMIDVLGQGQMLQEMGRELDGSPCPEITSEVAEPANRVWKVRQWLGIHHGIFRRLLLLFVIAKGPTAFCR
jgi:hypothetical protein